MTTPDTHSAASGFSWFLSADWAVLATELAGLFLLFALVVGILAWRGRKRRIKAARALIDERDNLAESATDTFSQHMAALLPEASIGDELLDDYQMRSEELINELVEPWLVPSPKGLQSAVRAVMGIRHTDLHQIAAIFRANQPEPVVSVSNEQAEEKLAQLKTDFVALQKAEAERSAQLAEALKSVSIIVSEYGRKFGVEADYRVPQILRTLIYLQAIDNGMDPDTAMEQADAALVDGITLGEEDIAQAEPAPTPQSPGQPENPISEKTQPQPDNQQPAQIADVDDIDALIAAANVPAPAEPKAEMEPTKGDVVSDESIAASESSPAPEFSADEAVLFSDDLGEVIADEQETEPLLAEDETAEADTLAKTVAQIDLDEIELPEPPASADGELPFELNLDDIDALLDAEIAKQQSSIEAPDEAAPLSDDDLDLSKKPPV